ncbi:MAG: HD domain-containing protein [Acidobacteriota bacterium]
MQIKNIDFPHKDFFKKLFNDEIYLVGGVVRDLLISGTIKDQKDIDLMVTGIDYNELNKKLSPFGKTNTVGKSFAVIKFTKDNMIFDISVPRKDTKKDPESSSHKNFAVESGRHISLEEDLARRDFTCNSMALRISDGKLFDLFDGKGDIEKKIIKMTGPETFSDDPLRLLRAARFASVLGFSIDEEIYQMGKFIDLDGLSIERVTEEFARMLLESEKPSVGMTEYFRLSILEKLFPEIYKMSLTLQDSIFHPEKDEYGHHTVFIHVMITLDIAKKTAKIFKLPPEEEFALLIGVILHDIGKPQTTKWEHKRGRMTITSILHDSRGTGIGEKILDRMKIDTKNKFPVKTFVLKLIKNHHRVYELYSNRNVVGFKAFSRLLKEMEGRDDLLIYLDFADRQSRAGSPYEFSGLDEISKWYFNRKEELKINKKTIEPIFLGRDLIEHGVAPGEKMGSFLKELYEHQLNGKFNKKEDGLEILKKIIEQ